MPFHLSSFLHQINKLSEGLLGADEREMKMDEFWGLVHITIGPPQARKGGPVMNVPKLPDIIAEYAGLIHYKCHP